MATFAPICLKIVKRSYWVRVRVFYQHWILALSSIICRVCLTHFIKAFIIFPGSLPSLSFLLEKNPLHLLIVKYSSSECYSSLKVNSACPKIPRPELSPLKSFSVSWPELFNLPRMLLPLCTNGLSFVPNMLGLPF